MGGNVMEQRDVTQCKFFSWEQARRNGKACVRNKDHPIRCWNFFLDTNCEYFEKNDLENEKV